MTGIPQQPYRHTSNTTFAKEYKIQSRRYEEVYELIFSEIGIHKRLLGWRRDTELGWGETKNSQ
jgi:hypothetical protein